ncbi:MAG: FlgD immunoglobulin-like domain containing protein [Endomicrobiia bacterium]
MRNNFFVQKNKLYKNFTRVVFVVVSCLFILKNQSKSVNLFSVSTLKPVILTNFPNPFTELTYIFVSLPQNGQGIDLPQMSQETSISNDQNVMSLKIFDLFGNLVKSYNLEGINNLSEDGFFVTWDGKDANGNKVSRGGYVCVLYYNNIKVVRKIGFAR